MLYHYTTLETLLAILQNSMVLSNSEGRFLVLRATHAYYLNDSKEAKLLIDALIKIGIPRHVIATCGLLNGYPYVFSLSEKNDDLNMWRGYANDAGGVSIGFDDSVFISLEKWNESSSDTYFFVKCEYVTSEDLANSLKLNSSIQQWFKENTGDVDCFESTTISRILLDAMKYKHETFCEEGEWRVVINSSFDEKYRATSSTLVPYKEFLIPISSIKSVTIGPKVDFERTYFSIKGILKQLGVTHVDINHSIIPYQ